MQARAKPSTGADPVPRLAGDVDPAQLARSPSESFLLSQVDGHTSWSALRAIGGVTPEEVEGCLRRWLDAGALVIDGPGEGALATSPAAGASTDAGAHDDDAAYGIGIDETFELPLDIQRRLQDFDPSRPYHELLGVDAEADRGTLKRAYFALSKQFHPDRYFRRNVGPYAELLDQVFTKIVEAYELLSDPTARAEVQRSLTAAAQWDTAPTARARATSEPASERPRRPRFVPGRGSRVFAKHHPKLRKRRAKAKAFFASGVAAFEEERWFEASSAVRLAIAYDPWNEDYKQRFAQVQRKAHEARALQLIKEGDASLELRDYKAALRAFEEAIHFRPSDAELLHRAGRLAWHTGGDLRQAKEWAQTAVEIAPEKSVYHRVLGQIYKAAGLEANARRELQAALERDPMDEEARDELRTMGALGGRFSWLGGRR